MSTEFADQSRIVSLLGAVPLCEGLDETSLATIATQLTFREFAAGETLASAGEAVREFWIIVEGEIEAFLSDTHGRESHLGVIRKGETIGEVAIIQHSNRPVRFTSRTSGALLAAPAAALHVWLDEYPSLMRTLFRTLSQRFKEAVGIRDRQLPAPRLGIIASTPRALRLVARLAARLLELGERLHVWAADPTLLRDSGEWPASLAAAQLTPGECPLSEPPPPQVDRRIVVWSPGSDPECDARRLLSCDQVLWMLEASDVDAVSEQLRKLLGSSQPMAERVRLVWLLNANAPVAPRLFGWNWKNSPIIVPIDATDGGPGRLERQGLDRLVHALRGYSIGIALAGGGAKGMAHFGVLRVLEEAGLSFDAMSGTSAGAMAGILYASGMSPQLAVEHFQHDLMPSVLFRALPKWPNWYLLSKFRRRAWDVMLRRYLNDWHLEQLPIPFSAVTVDLVQVRPVVRDCGDAVNAILESINLPVLSRPILRDGMVLVDGGILNNLPADVLVDRNVDFVVGVDVSTRVRHDFAGNRPDTPTDRMKSVGTLDTVFRIFEAQAHNIGNIRNRAVDFWITPDTSKFGLADFYRTADIAATGEAAAKAKLPELIQRLSDLKQRLLGSVRP